MPPRVKPRTIALSLGPLSALTFYHYRTDFSDPACRGVARGVAYWAKVAPLVLRYARAHYWYESELYWKCRRNFGTFTGSSAAADTDHDAWVSAHYAELHERGAQTAVGVITNLKGFYVKAGQFMSARPDVLPEAYINAFRALQNELPTTLSLCDIEEMLPRAWKDQGLCIEGECLGAASIGQTHRCRLTDTTSEVYCMKLQYPDARLLFVVDLACIRTVVSLLVPEIGSVFEELQTQFLKELDYGRELVNMERMARNLEESSSLPQASERSFTYAHCSLPVSVPTHCTDRILVMSFLEGQKLEDAVAASTGHRRLDMAAINSRLLGGDGGSSGSGGAPASAAAAVASSSLSALLLDQLPLLLRLRRLLQRVLRLVGGAGAEDGALARDPQQLIELLLAIHGEQLFDFGFFQADPHPGNFMLLADGKLGLIDFGQCKELSDELRQRLARLVLAVADEREDEIVRIMKDDFGLGKKGNVSEWFLLKVALFGFGELNSKLTDGRSLMDFSRRLSSEYKNVVLPGELYMPMRTAIMIRGLGLLLNCYASPARSWRPMAERCLQGGSVHGAKVLSCQH